MSEEKKVKTKDKIVELESKIESVAQSVGSIQEAISKLADKIEKANTPVERKLEVPAQPTIVTETVVSKTPIPLEYRQLVDNMLNRAFEIEINPRSDSPSFEFIVLVPKKYSNAGVGHWEMYKADRRPKVLTYADGINGVRDWCEKVFNNFNQDIRSMIVADRVNQL